jgi:ABC-2 type transport system permease protein
MKWEVRTMRFGTSFFNGTVWKKTFLRFWPIWAAYLAMWTMCLPLRGLMTLQKENAFSVNDLTDFALELGEYGGTFSVITALCFGVMMAMAVCSHLYSSRSANFSGALPVRREGLFLSYYLAGIAMFLLPNLLAFLLTAAVELAGGIGVYWTPLAYWLVCSTGTAFFFYSFAVFLGMFAGHILALPVFYVVFNILALAVYTLWTAVMSTFYYGYDYSGAPGLIVWLTPVEKLCADLGCSWNTVTIFSEGESHTADGVAFACDGLSTLAVYAAAGLVLAVLALLLYRRRQLESAGDVVAVRAMRPVFKYGVALCSGLFFGYLTSIILNSDEAFLMGAILVWGVAGYFAAQMILDKTFRVFRKWPGAAAVAAVFVALFLVVGFDLTGYETRIPDPASVEQVRITGLPSAPYDDAGYMDVTLDDPAAIEEIIDLHRAATEHRSGDTATDGTATVCWNFTLRYTLKNGRTMSREYTVEGQAADENTPGTVYWAISRIRADRNIAREQYGFDEIEEARQAGAELQVEYVAEEDTETENRAEEAEGDRPAAESASTDYSSMFYQDSAFAIWDAVLADFDDGNIGVHEPYGHSEERTLYFRWQVDGWNETTIIIAVPDTAVRTLAVIAELQSPVD